MQLQAVQDDIAGVKKYDVTMKKSGIAPIEAVPDFLMLRCILRGSFTAWVLQVDR